jgi:hypothetical protein
MSNEVAVKHIVVKIGSVEVKLTPIAAKALRDALSEVVGPPVPVEIHKIIIREHTVPWYRPYWVIDTAAPVNPYPTITWCSAGATESGSVTTSPEVTT